jgi:hypothetical protein
LGLNHSPLTSMPFENKVFSGYRQQFEQQICIRIFI